MCSVLETEYGWAQQEVPTLNSTWVGAGRDAVGGRWTDVTVTSSASVAVSASTSTRSSSSEPPQAKQAHIFFYISL